MKFVITLVILLFLSILPALAQPRVDAAVVLAVDVSGSITGESWDLQRNGLAAAIESKEFYTSISVSYLGRVAIAIVEWGSTPHLVIDWVEVETHDDLKQLATRVRALSRSESGGTCMIKALNFSAALLEPWKNSAYKRIIDMSGDGKENCSTGVDNPLDVKIVSENIADQNITINGLPIITPSEPKIDDFYAEFVIGGPGSFMLPVEGFKDFESVMKKKLIIEVSQNMALSPN